MSWIFKNKNKNNRLLDALARFNSFNMFEEFSLNQQNKKRQLRLKRSFVGWRYDTYTIKQNSGL